MGDAPPGKQSFWAALPAIIKALGGLIGGVAALLTALVLTGIITGGASISDTGVVLPGTASPAPSTLTASPTRLPETPPGLDPPDPSAFVTPVGNIKQNNPDIGCPKNDTRGFGFEISFDWSDSSSSADIAGYDLFVEKKSAKFPLVD